MTELADVYEIFKREISPIFKSETINIYEANGRILARDFVATRPLPPFDNSAMDGFVAHFADCGKRLKITGSIMAGDDASSIILRRGEAMKIMTGAMLPKSASGEPLTIAQKEFVKTDGDFATLDAKPNQNVRFLGEEVAVDSVIVKAHARLDYIKLSLIAGQGADAIEVFKRPKIAIFSTGDELAELGKSADPHELYNTNALTISSYLNSFGHTATYLGIIKDSAQEIESALKNFGDFDVVITSGGASVGDADLLGAGLLNAGAEFLVHGINTRPGRHVCVAKLKKSRIEKTQDSAQDSKEIIIVMLPGNPLASALHLSGILLPLLSYISGTKAIYPKAISLKNAKDFVLKEGTTNIVAGRTQNGEFHIYKDGRMGSNILRGLDFNDTLAFCAGGAYKKGEDILAVPYFMEFSEFPNFINEP